MADKPKLIKVCLTNRGHDTETPWAEDLGAVEGSPNARRAKIVNVPFLHAKPTWGDIVAVTPGADGVLTWDRDNVPWKSVSSRILEDGGRWAMIVDYAPRAGTKGDAAFSAFARACEALDIVCEGAWSPKSKEPGRAYLAVRKDMPDHAVMTALRGSGLPCEVIQVHPDPKKESKEQAPAKPAAKSAAPNGKPAAPPVAAVAAAPPAKKRAKTEPPTKPAEEAKPKAAAAPPAKAAAAPPAKAAAPPTKPDKTAKVDKSGKTAIPKAAPVSKSAPVKVPPPAAKPAAKDTKPSKPSKPAKKAGKPATKSR